MKHFNNILKHTWTQQIFQFTKINLFFFPFISDEYFLAGYPCHAPMPHSATAYSRLNERKEGNSSIPLIPSFHSILLCINFYPFYSVNNPYPPNFFIFRHILGWKMKSRILSHPTADSQPSCIYEMEVKHGNRVYVYKLHKRIYWG